MLNNISNAKRLIGSLTVININELNSIIIGEFKKRNNEFYDFVFNNNGKEIFLGRFVKEYGKINAKYKDGKILIYIENVVENEINAITNVLGLYEIIDDTFYSVTEEMALKIFDSRLNTSYLKNKNNLIAREDIKKKQKVNKKLD